MGSPAFKWFPTHREKNAYAVGNDELGNVWLVLEDYSFWRASTAGVAAATNWTAVGAQKKSIPLPMGQNWAEEDGTVLAAFADGASNTPGIAQVGNEVFGIRWNNAAAPDPIITTIPLPNGLNTDFDIVVRVIASKTGATLADATTFDVKAFFNAVGALYDADADAGATTDAMTGDETATTVQEVTSTIDASDLPSGNGTLTLSLQPTDGTLGTDDVIVHGVLVEYNGVFG